MKQPNEVFEVWAQTWRNGPVTRRTFGNIDHCRVSFEGLARGSGKDGAMAVAIVSHETGEQVDHAGLPLKVPS